MNTMFDTSQLGPLYEDFSVGATLPPLPSITLTEADNAVYRAVTGDQHPLAADRSLASVVTGRDAGVANPGLVMQYSIGQTTMATRQAIANLYYRSVRVLRPVHIGQTLTTTTTVLGLKDSAPKGEQFRGKVWLGITTSSEDGPVVEYERCALIRGRGPGQPGHADDIPGPSDPTPLGEVAGNAPDWSLQHLPPTRWADGDTKTDPLRDHVDLAAPLARLTFNQAAVHRDITTTANHRRLVYGGHVQGLAQASLTRMLPGLVHVLAWDGCDHIGPAFEGDLIEFRHTPVERVAGPNDATVVRFEVIGTKIADGESGVCEPVDILRWTPIVVAPLT
jgi:2-methylfumaryl-CoA hydratase